jgi:O-antigen/teichoic acid export membrane protein
VRSVRVLKNVLTNYLRLFSAGLIGFLITPVLVHLLGDGSYGIWVLVASLTGYLGILDQGVRPSLVRYVSHYRAAGDEDRLQATVNTALVLYTFVGAATMLLATGVSLQFDRFFNVAEGELVAAQRAVLLLGLSAALGFPLSVFGAVLSGLQRYDIANWIGIGVGVLRGVLFVVVLRMGGGLEGLAWTALWVNLLGHVLAMAAAWRLLPGLRISPRRARRDLVGRIASYSAYALVGAIAGNVIFQTDSIVITAFLSAALVTPFALAAGLVDNARQLVQAATWVLSPTASEMDTRGERGALHHMMIAGSKYSTLLVWPVLFALVIFGAGLLEAWVGERYVSSAVLITILAVPTFASLPQSTAWAVLYGISKHRVPTVLNLLNAAANLGLSILWVKPFGLVGVALGTALPLMLFGGLLTPLYACRVLELSPWRYAWEGVVRPGLVTLCFALPAWACELWLRPRGWVPLLSVIGGCWVLYAALAWRLSVPAEERSRWASMARGLWAEVRGMLRRTPLEEAPGPAGPR